MAYKGKGNVATAEGASIDKPPLLDPVRSLEETFKSFVKSKSLGLWKIIKKGDYIPQGYVWSYDQNMENIYLQWSEDDKVKVGENYLAIHSLLCHPRQTI